MSSAKIMHLTNEFINTVYFEKKKTDRKLLVQYLKNIAKYRDWIIEGLTILKALQTDENCLREDIALRGRGIYSPRVDNSRPKDHSFFLFMETFETESKKIADQIQRLKSFISNEIKLITDIKNAILALEEPQRSVFLYRYFEKRTWKSIGKTVAKSETFLLQLHEEGLQTIIQALQSESLLLLRKRHETLCW